MALQKNVNTELAVGVAGDLVNVTDKMYTAVNPIAETNVTAGRFVCQGTDPMKQCKLGGTVPMGIAQRVYQYNNDSLTVGASMTIPAGSGVSVIKKGYVYVAATAAATVGQKVFAVLADGTVKTGSAGGSVSGAVETDWTVMTPASEAGDIIVIGNI